VFLVSTLRFQQQTQTTPSMQLWKVRGSRDCLPYYDIFELQKVFRAVLCDEDMSKNEGKSIIENLQSSEISMP
jgi:hypothetical protein